MAKTNAEIQAAYRQRQKEEIKQLRADVDKLRMEVDFLMGLAAQDKLRNNSLSSRNDADRQRPQPTRARKQPIPPDWKPSADEIEYAIQNGLDPEKIAEDFRIYWGKHGTPMADWHLTWLGWCRKEAKDQPQTNDLFAGLNRGHTNGKRLSPTEKLYLGAFQAVEERARERTEREANSHDDN